VLDSKLTGARLARSVQDGGNDPIIEHTHIGDGRVWWRRTYIGDFERQIGGQDAMLIRFPPCAL